MCVHANSQGLGCIADLHVDLERVVVTPCLAAERVVGIITEGVVMDMIIVTNSLK